MPNIHDTCAWEDSSYAEVDVVLGCLRDVAEDLSKRHTRMKAEGRTETAEKLFTRLHEVDCVLDRLGKLRDRNWDAQSEDESVSDRAEQQDEERGDMMREDAA